MKRLPLNQPNFTVHRERDVRALVRLILLLACGLALSGGFVYAAGQRFAAVRYGYESEKLRIERARLLEEQRRLKLAREEASQPSRLESAALEMGLQPVKPAQIDTPNSRSSSSFAQTAPAMVGGPPTSINR